MLQLNKKQKIAVGIGILAIIMILIVPPEQKVYYGDGPFAYNQTTNPSLMVIYILVTGLVTGGAVWILQENEDD